MTKPTENVLSNFSDEAKELYHYSPSFHSSVNALVNGVSPYRIIEDLAIIIAKQDELLQTLIKE